MSWKVFLTQLGDSTVNWPKLHRYSFRALAKGDHSMTQMEAWDDAGFKLHDAELAAKKARDAYKNALRKKNYGF